MPWWYWVDKIAFQFTSIYPVNLQLLSSKLLITVALFLLFCLKFDLQFTILLVPPFTIVVSPSCSMAHLRSEFKNLWTIKIQPTCDIQLFYKSVDVLGRLDKFVERLLLSISVGEQADISTFNLFSNSYRNLRVECNLPGMNNSQLTDTHGEKTMQKFCICNTYYTLTFFQNCYPLQALQSCF